MTGPGAAWDDVPSWVRRNRDGLPAEQGTAGERAGQAYAVSTSGGVVRPTRAEALAQGRPRQRGVRRRRRDSSMDEHVVERVEQLAEQQHGGNYSAALQAVVEQGLAVLDAGAQLRAAAASGDLLAVDGATRRMMDAAGAGEAGHALAVAEVDRLVRSGLCPRCGQREVEHHGDACPPPV